MTDEPEEPRHRPRQIVKDCVFEGNRGAGINAEGAHVDLIGGRFTNNHGPDIVSSGSMFHIAGTRFERTPSRPSSPPSGRRGFVGSLPEMPWKRRRKGEEQPGS